MGSKYEKLSNFLHVMYRVDSWTRTMLESEDSRTFAWGYATERTAINCDARWQVCMNSWSLIRELSELCQIWYINVFVVADYESKIKMSENKMAAPI